MDAIDAPLTSGGADFTRQSIALSFGIVAILRAVKYRDNRHLVGRLDDFIDDDIRQPADNPFVRSPHPCVVADMRKIRIDRLQNESGIMFFDIIEKYSRYRVAARRR
jgi:hypothetical protein